MNRFKFFLVPAALCAIQPLHAATLDDVLVTATRVEQPIDQIIGATDVITRDDIEQLQPLSVQELLRNRAGIDLTSQGGLGKLTAMFIRGTENEHVLVLIDGMRAGSVSSGTMPFEYLPVDQIERIEIVRGPRSSLYGSDAIGGVIQIFTRKGGDFATARVGGGTYDTFQASGSMAATIDQTSITASIAKLSSQGFNSCTGRPGNFPVDPGEGCFADEPDNDSFSNRSGSLRVTHDAGFAEFDLSALYAEGNTQYDGFFDETAFREFTPSFRASFSPTENLRITLLAGSSHDDQDNYSNQTLLSTFNTERRNASLQSDLTLPQEQLLTLGVDFLDDSVEATTDFDATSRDNGGVFGQYQIGIGGHRVSLSARYDDNQQFGSHTTGNAGWKWQIAAPVYVMAAWGEAFRAPSFNDLYFPSFSNPDLRPERSDSYEIGVGGIVATDWTWSINAYHTEIDDLIALSPPPTFLPANISEAVISGVELEVGVALESTQVSVTYSYLDPRNKTEGANYDNILQRRSRQIGRLQATQELGPARLSTVVSWSGSRYNDVANRVRLDGYTTVDLLADFKIGEHFQIDVKAANVLDEEYETVDYYNEPGRNFMVSLQYNFR